MADTDLDAFGATDDDVRQRYPLIARPAPDQQAVTVRGLTPPAAAPSDATLPLTTKAPPAIPQSVGPRPTDLENQTANDRATQQRLSKGSGISQIGNPFGRAALRGLNIAGEVGSALVPELHPILSAIPGTEEHHQKLVGENNAALTGDEAQAEKEAQTANLNAQPELKQAALDLKEEQGKTTAAEKEAAEKDKTTQQQNALNEQYRKLGLKLDPATNQPVPIPYADLTPTEQAVHDLKAAQTEATDARAQLDKAKANPNSEIYQIQLKRLQIAEQNAQNASSRLQLSTEQFGNKLQEQELLKPSGQAQSRASAAESVLTLMPGLKTLVEEHRDDMGPIMGRLNRGEVAIGDVDPEVARLYAAMKSFYALQPAVHGFRNAEFVKDFESALGTLERNPDAFIAGMEGLKPTLESVAKEGKTFHKRIVEGGEGGDKGGDKNKTKDLGAAPQGKAEGSTGTLPDGTKVKVQGGRLVAQP